MHGVPLICPEMMATKHEGWDTSLGLVTSDFPPGSTSELLRDLKDFTPTQHEPHKTREVGFPKFPPALMLISKATVLSQPREPSFYLGGGPGKAPPLTVLIGLFIS